MANIKVAHRTTVGDQSVGAAAQPAVEIEVMPCFPTIDAPFTGDDMLDPRRQGRLSAIRVRGKQPGMDDVGRQLVNATLEAKVGGRVELACLADDVCGDTGLL